MVFISIVINTSYNQYTRAINRTVEIEHWISFLKCIFHKGLNGRERAHNSLGFMN